MEKGEPWLGHRLRGGHSQSRGHTEPPPLPPDPTPSVTHPASHLGLFRSHTLLLKLLSYQQNPVWDRSFLQFISSVMIPLCTSFSLDYKHIKLHEVSKAPATYRKANTISN